MPQSGRADVLTVLTPPEASYVVVARPERLAGTRLLDEALWNLKAERGMAERFAAAGVRRVLFAGRLLDWPDFELGAAEGVFLCFSIVPRRDGLWAGVGWHQIAIQRLGGHAAGNSDASLCGILATGSAEAITPLGVVSPADRGSELVAFARAMATPDADAFGAVHLGELAELFARRGNAAGRALLGRLAPRVRLAGWVRTGPNSEAVAVVDMVTPIDAAAVRSLIEEVFAQYRLVSGETCGTAEWRGSDVHVRATGCALVRSWLIPGATLG